MVQTWGLYLLPLAWLHWIGGGLLVIAAIVAIVHAVRRGPYRYVEEGLPLVVRVVALELRPTAHMNGQPTNFRYFATVEYFDPETGQLQMLETPSEDVSAVKKDSLGCTYHVGDYATAVYFPGDLARSLRLYGFLNLRSGMGVVKREGGDAGSSVGTVVGGVLVLFGMFFLLCWNVYAISRYPTVGWENTLLIPGIGGAVLLGGLILAVVIWQQRSEKRKREERNAAAAAAGQAVEVEASIGLVSSIFLGVIVFAGSLLMGGLTAGCWALTLNAWLDDSPPTPRPVRIVEMVSVTHNFILRRFEIKYQFLDDPEGKKHEYLSTPEEMRPFLQVRVAVAEQRAGFFGWRWVDRIVPAPGP
jgi:hypothetical protein